MMKYQSHCPCSPFRRNCISGVSIELVQRVTSSTPVKESWKEKRGSSTSGPVAVLEVPNPRMAAVYRRG
eukprot:4951753-Amphidinium_carterae.1